MCRALRVAPSNERRATVTPPVVSNAELVSGPDAAQAHVKPPQLMRGRSPPPRHRWNAGSSDRQRRTPAMPRARLGELRTRPRSRFAERGASDQRRACGERPRLWRLSPRDITYTVAAATLFGSWCLVSESIAHTSLGVVQCDESETDCHQEVIGDSSQCLRSIRRRAIVQSDKLSFTAMTQAIPCHTSLELYVLMI